MNRLPNDVPAPKELSDQEREFADLKLTELLEYATDSLAPGPGYSMGLYGVKLPRSVQTQLERTFGLNISGRHRAEITLGFDSASNNLNLNDLTVWAKSPLHPVVLRRTERGMFIPIVEKGIQIQESGYYLTAKEGSSLLRDFGMNLTPPTDSSSAYRLWRANLLSQPIGWQVIEKLEIPMRLEADSAVTITLENMASVEPDSDSPNPYKKVQSVEKTVTSFPATGSQLLQGVSATIELVGTNPPGEQLRMYKRAVNTTLDPFVSNYYTSRDENEQEVPMTAQAYEDYLGLIEEAITMSHQASLRLRQP